MNATRLSNLLLRIGALALLFTFAACDSDGDGDVDEADLIVGGWTLTGVTDTPTPGDTRDRLADFGATFSSFSVTFESDDTVHLVMDRTDPESDDVDIMADYELDQTLGRLTITVATGTGVAIPFTYEFENDDAVSLTTNATLMNLVFGTTLVGESTIKLQRLVQ